MSYLFAWLLCAGGFLGACIIIVMIWEHVHTYRECCDCGSTVDFWGCPDTPSVGDQVESYTCPRCLALRAEGERELMERISRTSGS